MTEDVLLNVDQVRELFGNCSRSTIWRAIKEKRLPPAIKLTRSVHRWRKSEVLAAIDKAASERDRSA